MASCNRCGELERRLAALETTIREARRRDNEEAVEAAIEEGRINREHRADWLRYFEESTELAPRLLGQLPPDRKLAEMNAVEPWSEDDEKAYRDYFRVAFGREPD